MVVLVNIAGARKRGTRIVFEDVVKLLEGFRPLVKHPACHLSSSDKGMYVRVNVNGGVKGGDGEDYAGGSACRVGPNQVVN